MSGGGVDWDLVFVRGLGSEERIARLEKLREQAVAAGDAVTADWAFTVRLAYQAGIMDMLDKTADSLERTLREKYGDNKKISGGAE